MIRAVSEVAQVRLLKKGCKSLTNKTSRLDQLCGPLESPLNLSGVHIKIEEENPENDGKGHEHCDGGCRLM